MKRIYRFSQDTQDFCLDGGGDKAAYNYLGGKGASLVKMCQMGMPVPPGFTISTDVCKKYRQIKVEGKDGELLTFLSDLMDEVQANLKWLDQQFGYMPLLSVRSGAPISMPGMMDTILNVGLTTTNWPDWAHMLGERAALDCERRLVQMLGTSAYGMQASWFEMCLTDFKKQAGVETDAELDIDALNKLIKRFKWGFKEKAAIDFPNTLYKQLGAAITAVFDSWDGPNAKAYRKINGISDDMGTAVTVQAMVFGNTGEDSGSGVCFSRNPNTGANAIFAEYLSNAQGEDVVAGTHTPATLDIDEAQFTDDVPAWQSELAAACEKLEQHYRDMVDVEFTVQKNKLYILQSRVGKRSAAAAFRIAHDLVQGGVISRKEALERLTRTQYRTIQKPIIDPTFDAKPDYIGSPACPGVVSGVAVFTSENAVNCTEPCILVRHETTPDDIAGMDAAKGILTQTGGSTSHAAVVARGMDKPCVVGCTSLDIHALNGKRITIDGSTGKVWVGIDVPVIDASDSEELQALHKWALAETGYILKASEPDPASMSQIMLADIWGATDKLDALFDKLLKCGTHDHIVLDWRAPVSFRDDNDSVLFKCFGPEGSNKVSFDQEILTRLEKHKDVLKGMRLAFVPSTLLLDKAKAYGYSCIFNASTIDDLLQGPVCVEANFIKNVCGGLTAFEEIKNAFTSVGKPLKVVPPAMPPEYVMFTVLKD